MQQTNLETDIERPTGAFEKRDGPRAWGLRRSKLPAYLLAFLVLSVAGTLSCGSPTVINSDAGSARRKGVYVPGPGARPQLIFACCDQGQQALTSMFADPTVLADLKELHAGLAIPIDVLSPDRAQLVRRLNEEGLPAVAWMVLPGNQGYYVNASNAPQTARWFAEFEKWNKENNLHWNAIGLDIEPEFEEFHLPKWRLARTLLLRGFDGERVRASRQAYRELINEMQAHGYRVQTYQLIFLADERKVHSTMLERLLGLVDVRGDEEIMMAYSSFNHKVGAAMAWSYGQDTQALAVGSTLSSGNSAMDAKYGPLNWEEFSRDTIVASHFSHEVGVYSLEGCVRQGFLPRLKSMDWNQGVDIPAVALTGMRRFRTGVQTILWAVSHLLYFATAFLIAVIWLARRWIRRKHAREKRV